MEADQIVNSYFTQQQQSSQQAKNPADNIVNGYFGKQNANPHPFDDTFLGAAKADQGDQSYDNYCESFAEQVAYGKRNLFPTAGSAWQHYLQAGNAVPTKNVQNAPNGAMIYFAPDSSNSGEGHVGFMDNGNLLSATSYGVKSLPLQTWLDTTHQKPLGYVIPNK